jgi:hypothetical protein
VTEAAARARARLGRYALWHLRDYLRDKGIPTLITLGLIGYLNYIPIMRLRAAGMGGVMLDQASDQAFVSALKFLGFLGVLFATNGMVADDRRHGYYRLLFAKPVDVVAYYAQKFTVYGIGFLAAATVLLGIYSATVEPFFPAGFLPTMALVYLALGGIGFLLSAAWRFDWLSLAVVVGASEALWFLFRDDAGWTGSFVRLLPPVHLLDGIYRAVRSGATPSIDHVAWLAAYGAVCFAVGLIIVRRRPLGT